MAKKKRNSGGDDIESYRHETDKRKNAVPVGLASYDTSKPKPKKYDYDPHLDPHLDNIKQSGNEPSHHFAGAGKPIEGGKGAVQTVNDYHPSRFACYLIAQNGDPQKPEIANAQKQDC